MPLSSDLKASYEAVLQDLESQRADVQHQVGELQKRLHDLNHSIGTISKSLTPETSSSPLLISRPANHKYANTSVRWAILDLLSDSEPKTTAEIADALLTGGIPTKAANFANNVSAVLSNTMKESRKDVEQLPDGKWKLTDSGHATIEHIRSRRESRGPNRRVRYARF
jgi:hypothetical protein